MIESNFSNEIYFFLYLSLSFLLWISLLVISFPSTIYGNFMQGGKLKASFHNFYSSHDYNVTNSNFKKAQGILRLVKLHFMPIPKPIFVVED